MTRAGDAIGRFADLDLDAVALLLDFDGTLVDIAPTPDAVHVSDELRASLTRLLDKTGGATALVSGRSIATLDRLIGSPILPAIGGHGAEMRLRAGGDIVGIAPPLPDVMKRRLDEARGFDPGIVVEDKGYSFTLHYRNAPRQNEALHRHIAAVRAAFPNEAVEVQLGKAVYEVKRSGLSKGTAVRELMTRAPFAGRTPVFIGDDETDKTVFALLPALKGVGFSVDVEFEGLAGIFETPAQVRRALQVLAAN